MRAWQEETREKKAALFQKAYGEIRELPVLELLTDPRKEGSALFESVSRGRIFKKVGMQKGGHQ